MFFYGFMLGSLISTLGMLVKLVFELKQSMEEVNHRYLTWKEFFKEVKKLSKEMKKIKKGEKTK
jgi:hypothetical protein